MAWAHVLHIPVSRVDYTAGRNTAYAFIIVYYLLRVGFSSLYIYMLYTLLLQVSEFCLFFTNIFTVFSMDFVLVYVCNPNTNRMYSIQGKN